MIAWLYGFFQLDMKSGIYFLTVGKTTDKKEREDNYKTTNANITFEYLKEVKPNYLTKAEGELLERLKKHYKLWKTSTEQFEIGTTMEDVQKAEKILLEVMDKVKTKSNDVKDVVYEYNTIEGIKDIRDLRKPCTFIPGEVAMIVTRAGVFAKGKKYSKERSRSYLTKYLKKGRRLLKLQNEQRVPVSNYAWDTIQVVQANERLKQQELEEQLEELRKKHGEKNTF